LGSEQSANELHEELNLRAISQLRFLPATPHDLFGGVISSHHTLLNGVLSFHSSSSQHWHSLACLGKSGGGPPAFRLARRAIAPLRRDGGWRLPENEVSAAIPHELMWTNDNRNCPGLPQTGRT
jgi:hypothetical protein